ncbi:MAG: FAD-dependent oxidoreductase [Deltaproteobacteria bacterium]
MTGTITNASQHAPPDGQLVDVCIVGSGSAGATTAWELARAGRDVLVLEEGGDYTGSQLTQRDAAMYDQLYMDRGGRSTTDLSITVLQGRVLGGGGVINASDVVPIGDPVLRHWQRRYGLADFSPEAMSPYRELALADLSVNLPTEAQLNVNNRLLREGAQALGWRGEVMQHNRVGCLGLGTCLIGCPVNAKRNPRFVAIPAALAAGARFVLRARAVRVEHANDEIKTVHVRALDARGYHEGAAFTVRARTVILAANAIASTQLALRSGIGNAHVGQHVSLQPQLPVTAQFDTEVRAFRGIPQSYAVTEFETLDDATHGWWGFRIEAIGGTPGIAASLLPAFGREGKELMRQYPYTASALLLTPDDATGRVRVESNGRLRIDYALSDEQKARMRHAIRATARLYLAAGARRVLVPVMPPLVISSLAELSRVEAVPFRTASAPFLSAHQQGGLRMAASPRDGATDPTGLLYGTRGVYAFDSSVYPSSASSHTMTPIITTSRYLARALLARLPARA